MAFTELNLKRLQAGHEREWAILIKEHRNNLVAKSRKFTSKRWGEDIAANVIASTYTMRMSFHDSAHLIRFMYSSVKYESYNICYREAEPMIGDDLAVKIEEGYGMYPLEEQQTIEQRIRWEKWKDEMAALIHEKAARMPTALKNYLLVWFNCGRKEVTTRLRDAGLFTKEIRSTMLEKAKSLVCHKEPLPSDEQIVYELRSALRTLSRRQRQAIKLIAQGMDVGQVVAQLGTTPKSVHLAIMRGSEKLRHVFNLPEVFYAHADLIRYITFSPLKDIIAQELERKYVKMTTQFTREQIREIVLLRDQQNLSWKEIAKRMGYYKDTIKKAYESTGRKRNVLTDKKLSWEQVLRIRELYKSEVPNQSELGRMFGVSSNTISQIVNNKMRLVPVQSSPIT